MTEASEEPIAALRERICDAGAEAHCLRGRYLGRWLAGTLVIVGVALMLPVPVGWRAKLSRDPRPTGPSNVVKRRTPSVDGRVTFWVDTGPTVALAVAIAAGSILVASTARRRRRRLSELRRTLSRLPTDQLAAVLLPLRDHALGDTRRVVQSLMSAPRVPTEVTPASAPAGRGDEPTP
jgi:hypothetical protein